MFLIFEKEKCILNKSETKKYEIEASFAHLLNAWRDVPCSNNRYCPQSSLLNSKLLAFNH